MLMIPPQRTASVCGWRITEGQMTSEYGLETLPSSALHSAYCPRVLLGRGTEETGIFLPGQGRLGLRAGPLPP